MLKKHDENRKCKKDTVDIQHRWFDDIYFIEFLIQQNLKDVPSR